MKLLLFTSHFPNSACAVRGVFNLRQAQALANLCEVRVLAPIQWAPVRRWHGAGPSAAPKEEEMEGLPTWHPRFVLSPAVGRDTHAAQMALQLLPHLARIRRTYPFDVLLATWAFPEVVSGAIFSRLFGVPLLAKVHGTDVTVQGSFPLRRRQIAWAMGQAHRVLAVSGSLKDRLVELGVPADKVMVHHNGVDRGRFRPADARAARARLGLDPSGKHVVFVGYLAEAKALHLLLEAAAALRAAGAVDFTTHLVGGGPLEGALRAQAQALGLGEAVRFHGLKPPGEVPDWMAAADVFCLPSVREGCPNVILEALASGRPVVATRVGGIPELVDATNALLVPPSDAKALAEALKAALERRWDAQALAGGAARFSWERSAEALFAAAQEATAQAASGRSPAPVAQRHNVRSEPRP